MRTHRVRLGFAALFLSLAVMMTGSLAASAQESPANQSARIVSGSCSALGTEVARLNDITPNDPRIGGSFSGQQTALGVLTSETDVRNTRLSRLLDTPHAIVIGEVAAPLACGDIGGFTRGIVNNDEIEIGISPVGDGTHFGIAKLEGDGNEVEIDLYIAAPLA